MERGGGGGVVVDIGGTIYIVFKQTSIGVVELEDQFGIEYIES